MLGRIKIYLLFIVAFGLHTANGQPPKTVKPNLHTSQKFKPPKLYTTLGIRSDTVAVVVGATATTAVLLMLTWPHWLLSSC